jgi:hypothetical protein
MPFVFTEDGMQAKNERHLLSMLVSMMEIKDL